VLGGPEKGSFANAVQAHFLILFSERMHRWWMTAAETKSDRLLGHIFLFFG
jgi:hypothetical protein